MTPINSVHSVSFGLAPESRARQLPATPTRSFTLIELLVVAGLMTLAVGVAAVRLDGFSQRGRLRAAVRQVGAIHSIAQLEAVSSGQPRSVVYHIGDHHGQLLRPEVVNGRWSWRASGPLDLGHRVTVAGVAAEGEARVEATSDQPHTLRIGATGTCPSYVVIVAAGGEHAAALINGVSGQCQPRFELSPAEINEPLSLLSAS